MRALGLSPEDRYAHDRAMSNARVARWAVSPNGKAWKLANEATAKRKGQKASAARTFRGKHLEQVRQQVRDWKINSPVKPLLSVARARALKRGMEFSIVEADLKPFPTHCPILGIELNYRRGGRGIAAPNAASLDRRDSSKGYIKGNVAIMSVRANTIKNGGTAAEHFAIAEWMERTT
jgi:hypothetical protein